MAEKEDKGAQAPASPKQGKESKPKYVVASPFADREVFSKMWVEGDDVSHFEENRLKDCIERGLVKKA